MSLAAANLDRLSSARRVPTYDRQSLIRSIVHLGVGGFHRAHLATYVDELCTAGHRDWSIVGAGVLESDRSMAEALHPQDGLYTLIARGATDTTVDIVGSLVDYVFAATDPTALLDVIAAPTTQIVSLTITEGGYPIDDVTGAFLPDSPNATPTSAFGLLAAGLDQRRQNGAGPLTVLSCDNIIGNGDVARSSLTGVAAAVSSALADWIVDTIAFPNSMVDRITPATTDADREWLSETHQIEDRWPVVTEPFRQWVIEDRFAGARLPLEDLDIIVTGDVTPYELLKLRLLNAGHSCLAYLAALDGIETVDVAMAQPPIRDFLTRFLHTEAAPVLEPVAGIDTDEYIASLVERFANAQIGDQISRLCLDGTAKFPKFLLPTVRAQLAAGGPIELAALALAGWCEYLLGRDTRGDVIVLAADPQLDTAVSYAERSVDDPAAFLEFVDVFGDDLASDNRFAKAFVDASKALRAGGVTSALAWAT